MDDCRADGSVPGEPHDLAPGEGAIASNARSVSARDSACEGDVIQGLRSGLIFSLAIWAVLLTVGAIIFV
jgi:hypothetical protein